MLRNDLLFLANAAPFTLHVDVTPPGVGDPCCPLKRIFAFLDFLSEFYYRKLEWKNQLSLFSEGKSAYWLIPKTSESPIQ